MESVNKRNKYGFNQWERKYVQEKEEKNIQGEKWTLQEKVFKMSPIPRELLNNTIHIF